MLRSLYSGISGMKNFQTKLDVIGNNIANVNTAGFKKSRVTFKDTMNQTMAGASASTANRGGKNAMQVGLGSTLATIDTITTGSSLQTTSRPLDLGIDGDGYFVVRNGNQQLYTRAGNFYLDDNGSLVNADGLKVQAYQYDENGNFGYDDVTVNVNAVLPPVTTKNLDFSGNLAADANIGTIFSQQIKTVDENGKPQSATVYFKKLGTNNWGAYINNEPKPSEIGIISQIAPAPVPPSTNELITGNISVTNPESFTGTTGGTWRIRYDATATAPNSNYQIDNGSGTYAPILTANILGDKFTQDGLEIDLSKLTIPTPTSPGVPVGEWSFSVTPATAPNYTLNFDANGNILSSSAKVSNERIDIPSGKVNDTSTTATDESKLQVNLDFTKLTQIKGASTALINPDGNTEGKLESFNVGSSGEINGVYSNGLILTLGQIAIAKFSNSSGLTKAGGNLFQETVNSGTPDINVAGNGRGSIAAGSLEMSNVDLSEEFTEMITAQRGFQANTRIITTSDEILQELVNLKR
jgi:flagellar hook protein FlgE